MLYYRLGKEIVEVQKTAIWGDGFLEQMSKDLLTEFPSSKGFSYRNLRTCRQFYLFYNQYFTNWKQVVSNLDELPIFNIPWGHNILIMQRCKDIETALFYVYKTIENNWSRTVLDYHIEHQLDKHQGKSINNFCFTLPAPQSDLAQEFLKDHYSFDFLSLTERAHEHDIETALVSHISSFLLELGQGFAYMGRQYRLQVGQKEYRIDLLFYHVHLKCYIVIELKATAFEPEFVGKLTFYTSAVDRLLKDENDHPTIGVLLCREKDDFEVEIALQDINKPIGVSTYSYNNLPHEIKPALEAFDKLRISLNASKDFKQ